MKKIVVSSFEELKSAMTVDYSLIVVDDKKAVQESIAYFKKKKIAGVVGTAGIIAGALIAWPFLVVGVGEKILNNKSYTFAVREDMQNCLVMKKNLFKDVYEMTSREIKENFNKYGFEYKKAAQEVGIKPNDIKKAFSVSYKEINKYSDVLQKMIDYIDKKTGKKHKYSLTELLDVFETYGYQ